MHLGLSQQAEGALAGRSMQNERNEWQARVWIHMAILKTGRIWEVSHQRMLMVLQNTGEAVIVPAQNIVHALDTGNIPDPVQDRGRVVDLAQDLLAEPMHEVAVPRQSTSQSSELLLTMQVAVVGVVGWMSRRLIHDALQHGRPPARIFPTDNRGNFTAGATPHQVTG